MPLFPLVLTGSTLPADVISINNNLIIEFSTDSSGVRSGFSFDYVRFYECPEGYEEADVDGPTCYKFGEEKSWLQAREDCRSTPGADLIVMSNALENRYIRDNSGGEEWWIGFYDGGTEGIFRHVECAAPAANWASLNWADGQPSRVPGNQEDCAYINGIDGYYYDDRCALVKKYVCETLKVEDLIPDAYYPSNFEAEVLSPTDLRLTWSTSGYACDVTGYTVSYTTPGQPTIDIEVTGSTSSNLDISDLTPNTQYTLVLTTNTFSFGTLPITTTIIVTTLPLGTNNCPTDYIQGPDFTCWKFNNAPLTWYDARLACQADDPNSDLAVIDTPDELAVVNATKAPTAHWIGLNDLGNERRYNWMDCSLLEGWQRTNWAPLAPLDPNGDRDCVELTVAGQWDNMQCDNQRPYICKIQDKGFTEEDMYPLTFTAEATSALTATATWVPSQVSCNLLGYYLIASDGGLTDDVVVDVKGAVSIQGEITGLMPDRMYVITITPYTAQGVLESRFATPIFTFNESTICPPGYEIGYNYGCYRFVTDAKEWEPARHDCMMSAPDGDLAIIDTQDEMNFFIDYGFGGFDWWIGLYDISQEGQHRWVDCSEMSLWAQNQWEVGQPSDVDGTEDCGQLQDNAKFNDRPCDRIMPYVCEIVPKDFTYADTDPTNFAAESFSPNSMNLEWTASDYNCDITGYIITYMNDGLQTLEIEGGAYESAQVAGLDADMLYAFTLQATTIMGPSDVTLTTTARTQPPANPCEGRDDGWFVGFEDRCYKVGKNLVTWDQAREDCMSVADGDLVIIETAEENEYLMNATLGNDFWIGFYDKATELEWSWVDCEASTDFAESNWAAGQPNDLDGNQDCGQITQFGQFNDWQCDRTMMYICEVWEKSYNPILANPRFFSGEAPNPSTVDLSWVPSQNYGCDVTGYRISYLEPGSSDPTIVDVSGAKATSVTIDSLQDGINYNFSISAILAAGPVQVAQSTVVTTPSLDDWCEPGWEAGFDYECYKFVRLNRNWDEARADCSSVEDGDLVIIETEEEFDYIRTAVNAEGDWWIGFHDKGTEGSFNWLDCQVPAAWVRNNWAPGQPNDLTGTQDCGQMLNSGQWNDWECDRTSQYICEVSPKGFDKIDQNPSLLRGEAIDANTIQLQWRTSSVNCEVLGYRIYVVVQPEAESYSIDVDEGETNELLIKNLVSNTRYDFDIAAILASEVLPPVGITVRIDTPASTSCGNTEFYLESGAIISPNYPEAYPNGLDCIYTILLPDSTNIVQLVVETLDLESGQDFLTIGSGPTVDEGVLVTLTGSVPPEDPIMTSSNQAWMRFYSDESVPATGFSISYESVPVEADGGMIGSVSIFLPDQTSESLTLEDYDRFRASVASNLNSFCSASQDNCLADNNGEEFTADDVIITSVVEEEGGIQLTFWVSDPNAPAGTTAALSTAQLEEFLVEYEETIKEEMGPGFSYIVGEESVSAIQEPWVIAVIALLGVCFLLLVVVLIRDCTRTEDEKTPSLDSVQMVPATQNKDISERSKSEVNDNVYYQSESAVIENETQTTKSALSPNDVATTSFSTPTTDTDAIYASPQKDKSNVTKTTAAVEASESKQEL